MLQDRQRQVRQVANARLLRRLLPDYHRLYRRGSYVPKEYQQRIGALVSALARQHGMNRRTPAQARNVPAPATPPRASQPRASQPPAAAVEQTALL